MNILDIGILLVLLMFIIAGSKNGVIKECVSLVGIILVFLLSFALKDILGNILVLNMPWYTFKGYIFFNIFLYQALGFIITFGILLIVFSSLLSFSNFIQKVVNSTIILVIPSKILGAIVSFIKGYIIIYVILLIAVVAFGNNNIVKDSEFAYKIIYNSPIISSYTKKFTEPIKEINKLMDGYNKKTMNQDEINVEAVKIMLKYDVVSQKVLVQLKNKHRFDSVVGIGVAIYGDKYADKEETKE